MIKKLIHMITTLRGDQGCPWDKEQTPESLTYYLKEETYELTDAVQSDQPAQVCRELGDVLFLVLFIACLYEEQGEFTIQDVIDENQDKMTRRHPHVFGPESIQHAADVRKRWNEIKKKEKHRSVEESILSSIPIGLPALMRAYRISERAAGSGFDWDDLSGVMDKVEEEWLEFVDELKKRPPLPADRKGVSGEFGDLLFTLVNVARFARIHPETALAGAVKKFENRFRYMENRSAQTKQRLSDLSRKEMDRLWEEAKQKTR